MIKESKAREPVEIDGTKTFKLYSNYTVYNDGRIYSKKNKIFLKPVHDGKYFGVSLAKDKEYKKLHIHRIVATCFVDNPNNYPYVNHIDGNKLNNHYSNLEWCTPKQNALHAIKNGLYCPRNNNRAPLSIRVYQFDLHGKKINEFPSVNEAYRQTGISAKWIRASANGGSIRISGGQRKWVNCKSAGGFVWSYRQSITFRKDLQQVKQTIEKL